MTTSEELADLAEGVVPVADRLVHAVHFEGVAAVARLLDGLSRDERAALPIVLAAMVDPTVEPEEALAWASVALPDPAPSLFDGVDLASDPRTWSDEVIRKLALEFERSPRFPRSLADAERLRRAQVEWERREYQKGRRPNPTRANC